MATVYIAFDGDGEPLYVGQTGRDMARLVQHHGTSPWWTNACTVDLIHLPRGQDGVSLEKLLIHELKPPYNRTKARPTDRCRKLMERILSEDSDLRPREARPEILDWFG